MSSKTIYQAGDQDQETLIDFYDSLKDELEDISGQLLALERDPTSRDSVNALFRSVHSVKGNCRMCFLDPFSGFVHAIEEVISEVRNGRLPFTPLLGEAVSLSFDHLRIRTEDLLRNGKTNIALFEQLIPLYSKVKTASIADTEKLMEDVIRISGGQVVADVPLNSHQLAENTSKDASVSSGEIAHDVKFFSEMANLINNTCPHWESRSVIQLSIAIGINQHLAIKQDPYQLTAAIYLHDLGMTFLPQDLVNKNQRYNALEEKRVHEHVTWSYEWAKRLPGWQAAAEMILQHHERPDGKGYPQGLCGNNISDGAQIIAVTDAFFALTNERPDRNYKKSLMRAITEINAYRDIQFKGSIIDAFNSWIREIYKKSDE